MIPFQKLIPRYDPTFISANSGKKSYLKIKEAVAINRMDIDIGYDLIILGSVAVSYFLT